MTGARAYVIAVACDVEEKSEVVSSLGARKVKTCYIYSRGKKQSGKDSNLRLMLYDFGWSSWLGAMTGSMQLLCIGLYGEANLDSRKSLLMNEASVKIKDDMGQLLSFHPDWEENRDYTVIFRNRWLCVSPKNCYILVTIDFSSEISDPWMAWVQKFLIPGWLAWVQKSLTPGWLRFRNLCPLAGLDSEISAPWLAWVQKSLTPGWLGFTNLWPLAG